MRTHQLLALLLLGASPMAAQVRVFPGPAGPGTIPPGYTVINVQAYPYNAVSTQSIFQTAAIQSAITAACALVDGSGNKIPGIVFIPAGIYAVSTLNIPCSGLTLKGANLGAADGTNQAGFGTILNQAGSGATAVLTVGAAGASVSDVTIEDILLEGASDANNAGIVDLNCQRCHLNRVSIESYGIFGVRFLGLASAGTGGFSTIHDCYFTGGRSNSFAVVTVTQTGSAGGPDGNAITDSYFNTPAAAATGAGWFSDSVVAGATTLTSSTGVFNNRFESANNSAVIALTGSRQDWRFLGNRWENTGSGGLTITLANAITTDPTAYFMGNLWACGSGLCTWTDNGTTKAIRFGDTFGPSTNAQAPGVICASAQLVTSDAGSPDTLGLCTVPGGSVNGSGSIYLHIRAWGHTANNANAKTASLVFAGVTLITITETVSAADAWLCDVILGWRAAGASVQSLGGECSQGSGTVATPVTTAPTLDFSLSQAALVSVTQVAAADMFEDGFLVEVLGPARAITLP